MADADVPTSLRLHPDSDIAWRSSFLGRMCWDRDLPPQLVEQIWSDPEALLLGQSLQDKQRCSVARVNDVTGSFVWKRYNWGTPFRRMRKSLQRTPAHQSWLDGRFLFEAGIPTPRPRAFLERRLGPFKTKSYLLTDYVLGTSLYRLMRFGNPSEDAVQKIVTQVVALWQRLDELQVQHNDFKPENLIVDPNGKVWLIDLERMCRYRAGEQARRKQLRELEDLLHPRNWRAKPQAGELLRQQIVGTTAGKRILAAASVSDHPLRRSIESRLNANQLVSVVIPCRNAAATIIPCLRSVYDMADEIVVADMGSTDGTLDIVREFGGCKIVERAPRDGAKFAAWLLGNASHRWIVLLQPDEQLSPELAREVQDVLATNPEEAAFAVNYVQCFRGQRLSYGGLNNKPVIRLFQKNLPTIAIAQGGVHLATASHRIGHIYYAVERELCHNAEQHLQESIDAARAAQCENPPASSSLPHGRIVRQAVWKFLKPVALQFGWLDGWAGIHAHLVLAMDEYLKHAVPWDAARTSAIGVARSSDGGRQLRVYSPENQQTALANRFNLVEAEVEELRLRRSAA